MIRHANILTAAAIITCLLGSGCSSLAVNNYIKEVRTSPSRATEPSPPTCTQGKDGKQAIKDAFAETKPGEDVGGLRVATFLSLACSRTRAVANKINGGSATQIYKARVPIDEDDLQVMVEAWAQEPNESYRDAMSLAFYELDFATLHELYARLRERDALLGTEVRPLGNYYVIEEASEAEAEAVRLDWCARLGDGDRDIFLSPPDKGEDTARTQQRKLESFQGLIGNECEQTTEALTGWVTLHDALATEILTAMPDSADPISYWPSARAKIVENGEANAFPPVMELGKEIARQGLRDGKRPTRYLETIEKAQPSCAFVAELTLGFDLLDEKELATLAASLDAWEQRQLETCGLEQWPE